MAEKTTGQWVGTIVGAVVGYFTGGTGYILMGAAVGGAAGAAIDPPKGPHLVGPRLSDLSTQTATYGANIPRIYGNMAVSGNVFWIENNALKEVTNTESQGGKGGGGGAETTTYAYYATFAVGLCDGPIAGVRRIWVGSKLIYDAGSVDIEAIRASKQSSELFTLYKGTDAQLPDDRMQATLGTANVPAYRGLAYLVFKDFPLKDHGNSLLGAPVKVEVISLADAIPDAPQLYHRKNSQVTFSHYNNQTPRPVLTDTGAVNIVGLCGESTAYKFTANGDYDGFADSSNASKFPGPPGSVGGAPKYISSYPVGVIGGKPARFYTSSQYTPPVNGLILGSRFNDPAYTDNRGILPVFAETYIGNIVPCADGEHFFVTTGNTDPTLGGPSISHWYLLKYQKDSVAQIIRQGTTATLLDQYQLCYGPACFLYFQASILSSDLSTIWVVSGICNPNLYINRYKIGSDNVLRVTNYYFQGVDVVYSYPTIAEVDGVIYIAIYNKFYIFAPAALSPQTVTLASIVSAECVNSSLLSTSDIDVTGLNQPVRGYAVSNVGAIRSAIDPLQASWPFDVLQAGYKIKFKPRGTSSVADISTVDLDARDAGEKPGVSLSISREMDSVIPSEVSIKHFDINREYDIGEQYAARTGVASINKMAMDQPIAMTSSECAGLAEMLLYLYWLERYDVSLNLPPIYRNLEPGDVVTVNAEVGTYSLRLTAINYLPDGRLECSAKFNSPAIYAPTAMGEDGQSSGVGIGLKGSSEAVLLDIPCLLDATNEPGFMAAVAGYGNQWPGATLSRTEDSWQTWTVIAGFAAPGATFGKAANAVGAGIFNLIDKSSLLQVNILHGALSSVTESLMLNGANHFAYGVHGRWEIIAAQTCALQSDGSYILSGLLRGRFGTEWAAGLHVIGDSVVLLDSTKLAFIGASLNSIGLERTYRAVTSGASATSASETLFTYTGVNLECLAPIYLNGNRHPTTNDWSLDWIRRTRIGGEWRDYVDATLGESAQSYEVEIYDGASYAAIKRTITGLTTPAATYTSANQVTDFGSNQAVLYVKIYQLSANVGRGYPLTTSITR